MTSKELITLNALLEGYRGSFPANSEMDDLCFKVEKQLAKDITTELNRGN